jgi:hypothetical protein
MRISQPSFCLLLLLFLSGMGRAQDEKTFKAVVLDSAEKMPIEKCTVTLFHKKGDTKRNTDPKGLVSFILPSDSSTLLFQHVGYREKSVNLLLSKIGKSIDTILLSPADKLMDGIVVKAKVPPVVVRGDTTEFNIDSAMFEPFDVVDDLVRRLPGLEIDAEGKMTFHGKPITRILVDGEDLFGGDPDFSLKKLPAGLVAKIQVMDTKTLEQLFNGTPTDGEDKTLNIKLKGGNKTFGSGDIGAGTSNHLEGNLSVSQFDERRKIAVVGSANTTNNVGFLKQRRGPTSSFGNASTNYSNGWEKIRLNSSYGYSQNGNSNNLYRERTQLITADTSFFSRIRNFSDYNNNSHRFSMGVNWFIDSSSALDLNFSYHTGSSEGESQSSSVTLENGALRNESLNNSSSANNTQSLTGTLTWVKRMNRKGRRFSVNARVNVGEQQNDQLSLSVNTYFKTGLPVSGDTLDRQTKTSSLNRSYHVSLTYIEPITKHLRFDLRGELNVTNSKTNRAIYNLDTISKTAVYDSLYSAAISSSSNTQNLTASLNYTNEKWNVSTGVSTVLQQAVRTLQKDDIQQNLLRYAPSLNATYNLAKGKVLRASFSGNTIQPTIEQLQPVPDNSNPLYVRLGNPNLRTAFSQTYVVAYIANDFSKTDQNSLTLNLAYSPINNQIVNAVYYDEFRRQTSRYINVAGVYSLRSNVSITRNRTEEKKVKGWAASSGLNFGQQVYFQNNNQYYSRNYSTNLTLSFSKRELVVRSTRYNISLTTSVNRNWTPADVKILNTTRLSIAPQIEGGCTLAKFIYATASYRIGYNKLDYHSALRRNDEYSMHQVNSDFRFQVKKNYWVNTTLFYQYNTRVPEGTPKGIVNFNLSATAQVMKGRAQLVFTAVDLFAMSTSLQRTVGENFIEDMQVDNLQNYFTLKFQYNFSRLEKRETRAGRAVQK